MASTNIMSILQASYSSIPAQSLMPLGAKFATVDATKWQGDWTGTDSNGKAVTLKIAQVSGYRANANLQSVTTGSEQQRVFITTKNQFRIGNSSFALTGTGTGQLDTIVTDPNTGIQTDQRVKLTLQT